DKKGSDFLRKVTDETIQKYIKPRIDGYHKEIIRIISQEDIPLYFRNNIKTKALYDRDKVKTKNGLASPVFRFDTQDDGNIRYQTCIFYDGKEISLTGKSHIEITNNPASVVINNHLLYFNDIDSKKLLPFYTKEFITVPAGSRNEYISKFIYPCVKNYNTQAYGLNISEITPARKALLTIEYDLNLLPYFILKFLYDNHSFTIEKPYLKNVYLTNEDDQAGIVWFYRDKVWEQSIVKKLKKNGLKYSTGNGFRIIQDNHSLTPDHSVFHLINWLNKNAANLGEIEIDPSVAGKNYYMGEINLNSKVDEQNDWFDIRASVKIGDFEIPFIKFRRNILEGVREYTLPDQTIVILPAEWFDRHYEIMLYGKVEKENIILDKMHQNLVSLLENTTATSGAEEAAEEDTTDIPSGMNCTLRNYQVAGFKWLVHLYKNNRGGCLADDMGLGKTIQAIALLEHITTQRRMIKQTPLRQLSLFEAPAPVVQSEDSPIPPSLIIMPTSLLHNWRNEIVKFAPNLRFYIHSGANRLKTNDIHKVFALYDVILTTYGTLRNDIEMISNCEFHHLIMDESQYVKNPRSQIYKSIKRIRAHYKLSLTGTPIENSLTDLWTQFDIINEGLLGSFTLFRKGYIDPIKRHVKKKEEMLHRTIQPYILRRTKKEVAPELPELTEEYVYCEMDDDQKRAYNLEKDRLRSSMVACPLWDQGQSILAIQGLLNLRFLASHPVLFDPGYQGISNKFEQIIMYFENLKAENHKVLIFSSFVKHLQLLADYFDQQKWDYAWLTGQTKDREAAIEKFRTQDSIKCFFISLKAGGVGLNLTEADYVFIIDPWWNPAAELQAISRSHRIGQEKNVMVYRFITSETIEEKIITLQQKKSRLFDVFMSPDYPVTKEDYIELLE
ncbi:MAG: DEAD/DEAH box helicase, partial [Tannerella sp.]|nr:DEAD/DEAH box helicase [Tannerella sp.]